MCKPSITINTIDKNENRLCLQISFNEMPQLFDSIQMHEAEMEM